MNRFQLLGSPVRHRVVEVLALGEHDAGLLEQVVQHEFGIGRAAAQHHLAALKRNGAVRVFSDWRERSYRLSDDLIPGIERDAAYLRGLWEQRYGWAELYDPVTGKPEGSLRDTGRNSGGRDDEGWF